LAALALAAAGVVAWLALGSLPQVSGTLRVAGLSAPVEVVRDRWAVPHVRAASEEDAYRAVGFLHAQDRLWQMELNRRVGQGRLAAVLGPEALPADRLMRTLGLARAAEASVGALEPGARRLLEAYAEGVNAFLALGRRLPPEFLILRHRPEPWRAADSVLFLKLMALDLSRGWRAELARARLARALTPAQIADLWPESDPLDPVTLAASADALRGFALAGVEGPPAVGALGSNEWVVAGSRTATGAPLLANDPHLGLTAPGVWYLAHLEVAGGISVIGATLPSVPFVVLGRTPGTAWGFTNTGSDVQDLFVETVDPADPGRYLAPGGSLPFAVRTEEVEVRGGQPVRLVVRETRHGPVVSDVLPGAAAPEGRVLALAWTGLDPADRTAEAGFRVARARDWDGFVAAFEMFGAPQQNIAYADRAGRIGLLSPGRVPVRAAGDGRLPAPGGEGAFDWTGFVPYAALPRTVDPPRGYLLNANNRLVGEGYPHLLAAEWEPPYRARRIEEVLEASPRLDQEGSRRLQLDQLSTLARELLPALVEAAEGGPDGDDGLAAALRAWDGTMNAARPEPLVFSAWYAELGPLVWGDELAGLPGGVRPDALARMLRERQAWCDDVGTAGAVETCAARSRLALERALAWCAGRHGSDWRRWRWDAEHRAVMEHRPFDRVPWLRRLFSVEAPVGGSGTTVNVASYQGAAPEAPFLSGHGPSYRALYDLADPERSLFVAPAGQSGHPLSRHYRDLARLWREGAYLPMTTSRAAYEPDATGRLALVP
jgi:penicillin G amidase